MPRLRSTQHEIFATALAAGNLPITAYSVAGYTPDVDAATKLSRTPLIERRVDELAPILAPFVAAQPEDLRWQS